ncbi:hypothetical protein BGZ51_006421 [Haplosporangium sp. Z 767]|nr:hypothetical protein BGZ51_006421 [Haplosporangium sp. Z 767]KAF9192215.1 hypothetical protein BGZ50_008733 [Haplosporangium sp. Z 11]
MTAISESPAPNGTDSNNKPPADEVGRAFVHEYYTFLHKDPSRLHLFYNKISTLSHGTQGEEAIRDKILSLGFEGCKVLISNLDCQSSINGGIVIQVLGEMSNRSDPSQRFVQTFFLAEQHMGYYVHNDIFRYLKEDTQEEYVEEAEDDREVEDIASQSTEPYAAAVVIEESETAAAPVDTVAEDVTPKLEVKDEMPAPAPAVVEEKNMVPEEKAEKKGDKKSDKEDSKDAQTEIKKEAEVAKKQEPTEPTVMESVTPSAPVIEPKSAPTAAPEPAPAPAQPPKAKTWANLAASNSNQWGSHVAATKAATVNVAQASPKPQPQSQTSQAHGQNKPQGVRPNGREEYHSIYIKNVTERMTLVQLREAFTKFGKVNHLEFTQKRNCAFLDFATPDAVIAALKQHIVPVGNETVLAEERRRNSNNSGPQSGRTFQHHHHHNSNNVNGHGQQQQSQGGRGGRANNARGGPSERKPGQGKPEKAAHPVHAK